MVGASVVVGGSVGTVTSAGLSPLIDGLAGSLSLQAVNPRPVTARRATRALAVVSAVSVPVGSIRWGGRREAP